MEQTRKLKTSEEEFFSVVYRTILANPFGEERKHLDVSISGLPASASESKRVERVIDAVGTRVRDLDADRRGSLQFFSGNERKLVKAAFLFDFFYHYRKQYDQHIRDQIQAGENPVRVNFAPEALGLFRRRGFTDEEALRYFGLCYQLRRAYFFIYRSLVGRSPAMKQLRYNLWNNVFTHNLDFYDQYLWNRMEDFSTMILGETGTGKGTAAAAIGRSGFIPFIERKKCFAESFTHAFTSLNLSQFPETLIESELFGHKKGAFTGAVKDHRGIFERSSPYGAILLDEIGDVSPQLQIKLLQVLQERVFSPVGSHQSSRFQGRVIAATNRSMGELRRDGSFRDDFYYRLCSDLIVVPPLRQRIEEDPAELEDLLTYTVEKLIGRTSPELAAMVQEVVETQLGRGYRWPGNVRELEQCVRRVLLKRNYCGDIRAAAPGVEGSVDALLTQGIIDGDLDVQRLTTGYCYLLYERYGTFEEVARRTRLDRRTVKKYIQEWLGEKEDEPSSP